MPWMVFPLDAAVKSQLKNTRRRTGDKGLALRCHIVLLADEGYSRRETAIAAGCSLSWVKRVLARFREMGLAGLEDRRQDNGQNKLDEWYLAKLRDVVSESPHDYGYPRPTWTRELLVAVMALLTGTRIHPATMSRALKMIDARRGRPRPMVACPWPEEQKKRRIQAIHRLVRTLPDDEVAVFEDEVDIHLNPKVGLDWMNRGEQKLLLTPGQNKKRYIAGALDAKTGRLTWVEADRKNSDLFICLLKRLAKLHRTKKKIHVIMDNYRIHHSNITQLALESFDGKIVPHYLPPYCPQHNPIERVWLDLHANVTRNHCQPNIEALMDEVHRELAQYDRQAIAAHRRRAA